MKDLTANFSHSLPSNRQVTTTTFLIMCLFPLLFLSTLNETFTALKPVGLLAINVTLLGSNFILLGYYAFRKKVFKLQLAISVCAIPFAALVVIGMLLDDVSSRSYIAIFQLFTLIGFFTFACLIKWDDYNIKIAKRLAALFIVFLPFVTDIAFIGPHIAFTLFFVLLERKKTFFNVALICLSVVLIYYSDARAVFLLIGSAALTYACWSFISRTKLRFILFFLVLVTGLLSFIFIYTNLRNWSNFYDLNDWVRAYTGGNLLSGRQDIWIVLMDLINQKPLLGYGTGILTIDITGATTLSAHNLYVQTMMQNGYIGVALLLFFFFAIWLSLWRSKTEYATRLSASFFVGILLYQSFEVVLTQNKVGTALMFWLIISVGVSHSLYGGKKKM